MFREPSLIAKSSLLAMTNLVERWQAPDPLAFYAGSLRVAIHFFLQ